MKAKLLVVLMMGTLSFSVLAQESYNDDFFTVDSVEVEELDSNAGDILLDNQKDVDLDVNDLADRAMDQGSYGAQVKEVIAIAEDIIAFGEKVYKIVEKGRPVLNINSEAVSVLPRVEGNTVEARDLAGWAVPDVKKYKVSFKNAYRMEVAALEVMLVYSYGGSYNGKGFYITNAQIKPVSVNVMWGFKMDISFKVQSITNVGTKENPVAAAVLMLDYSVSTVLQERKGTKSYFITGKGQTKVL